jgi:hypothetical protein
MVRFIVSGILTAALACGLWAADPPGARPQQTEQAKPKDQMFSGVVTSVDDASLTASRDGQGKPSVTKTFAITAETTFEGGRPKVSSRVTVRYVSTDDGDRAIHVIVRGAARK